ncbi:hypothetical protein [Actinoplanes sp. NPDC051494]|uniref:hypothetical protein n=1 Tax=Actinoplanes sp. NPDC051494 TaxID=3363907 RepID=UPI003790B2DB
MELSIEELQEEELTTHGDFYSLALFRENGSEVEGLEVQRTVGGIYGDPATGAVPYCVVTAGHGTNYGGIERVIWSDASVELVFTEAAREVLSFPDRNVVLRLDMSETDRATVKAGLRRAFVQGDIPYRQPELVNFG